MKNKITMKDGSIKTETLICKNCNAILSRVMRFGKRNTKKYLSEIYCSKCTKQ